MNQMLNNGTDELHRRAAVHNLENSMDKDIRINVTFNSDEAVALKMKEMYDMGREKIQSLNNLFETGLIHAHYEFDEAAVSDIDVGNGTGYYDPLAKAFFINEHGVAIGTGRSVRFLDTKSNRRLWIVVVQPGKNIIVHDRFSGGEKGMLVCTSSLSGARDVIGMAPAWTDGCTYDFVMACRLFGFEYDRSKNEVYMPHERNENGIDHLLHFFR